MQYCIYEYGILCNMHKKPNAAALDFLFNMLSTRGRIVKNDEIVEYNRRIAEALDLTGYIVAQYIGNKIIEINPRWSTSIIHGSVNEFLMGVKVWTGEQIDIDPNDVKIQQTLTYERYYETLIHDDQGNQF